jgi:seryl-tRNA(Sec) selenium transferase
MQRWAWRVFFIGLLLNAAAIAQSQSQSGDSLADMARANRAKQQAQEAAGAKPKIITNQDLPSAPSGIPESVEPMTTVSGVKRSVDSYSEQRANQRQLAELRTGEQWKARIQDQEARIADLQTRIDRVNQSMRAAVGTAQYDTPVNRYQSIQMERLAHMQEMLDQQQRRLSMMQDAARLTGMGQ